MEGTCHGSAFIDRNLVIKGVKTSRRGKPILDGDGKARVLTIKAGVRVTVQGLTVQGGRASRVPYGGGIVNRGTVMVRNVGVRHNQATFRGGGIFNEGTIRMTGSTRIKRNAIAGDTSEGGGAGVYNTGGLVLADRSGRWQRLLRARGLLLPKRADQWR